MPSIAKFTTRVFALMFVSLISFSVFALTPKPPTLNAEAYILMDFKSQRVIASKNENERVDLASLTKMMTMYVIDHELKNGTIRMTDKVNISEKAWRAEGSRMFIEVGTEVTVEDLIKGIIIQSGNDASIALAEYVAGSEEAFVALMNFHAKKLGMVNTNFTNATGFTNPNHYSTAKDLAILSVALIAEFPESYSWYSEKWFTFNGIKQPNRNRLLWREDYVDGIKTGHTDNAGFCIVASGEQSGMRLISVVLGAKDDDDRTVQSQKLLRYGFRFYETHHLFGANKPVKSPRVWMGSSKNLNLGLAEDLYITIPHGQYEKLDATMSLNARIEAPVSKGNEFGVLRITLDDEVVAEKPLVALEQVNQGGVWTRFSDYISLSIHKLLGRENS